MTYRLANEFLSVTLSDRGAELLSVRGKDGLEYLWQGDPRYWEERAPWMFPICGRLFGGSYTYGDKTYELPIHGFARAEVFRLIRQSENSLTLELTQNERTLAIYPFAFSLTVTYTLEGELLSAKASVRNTGDGILPAALGFHPGFRVPPEEGSSFEDWQLVFGAPCEPRLFVLSPSCFLDGTQTPFPLKDGRSLPLTRSLFDHDALFLSHTADSVTLCSHRSERSVTVRYPDVPYVGFWQLPHSDAPYVCVEPWHGLPSVDGVREDLAKKPHMFRLRAGESAHLLCQMRFS